MKQEREELERLLQESGGILKIEQVVERARDSESVLHKHFEWDDSAAAEEHRKAQARSLIQRCNITLADTKGSTIRAFVSLPTDRDAGGGYRLMREVMASPDLRAQLQAEIEAQVQMWRHKAKLLSPEYLNWVLAAPIADLAKVA